jgi:GT2 family glycosyltransferase
MRPLGVIIPIYHTGFEDYLRIEKCLEALRAQTVDHDVMIVNNGSTAPAGLNALAKSCRALISFDQNRGYAPAINAGMRLEPHLLNVFLNDDCYLHPNALSELSKASMGGVVSMIRAGRESCPEPMQGFDRGGQHGSTDASCWMIPADIWTMIGPLDERFELGTWEDSDWFQRMDLAGVEYGIVQSACAHHPKEQTWGKLPGHQEVYLRNMARFKEKWGFIWGADK